MHGGEYQMSGLCGSDRRLNRFRILELSDENDVRVLTKRLFQCNRKGRRVSTDLSLFNDALFVLMHIFNRIFQTDDNRLPFMIN